MSDVIEIRPMDNPDNVLEDAKGVFSECIVIGYDHEGYLGAMGTSSMDNERVVFIMEMLKNQMLNYSDE